MHKCEMGVPCRVRLGTESKGMVARETEVVAAACIDESEPPGRSRVPGVGRDLVERGLQLRLKGADVRSVNHRCQILQRANPLAIAHGFSPPKKAKSSARLRARGKSRA